MTSTKLAVLAGVACLCALGSGLSGWAGALGIATVALLVLLCWLGLAGSGRPSIVSLAMLAVFGAGLCAVIVMAYRLHDPSGHLTTVGGLPAGTAMLVYGLPLAGSSAGILYGLRFDREILPEASQRQFLKRFGKR